MDHLDLAGVLTTPPQCNVSAFEQQDAVFLSSSRQMLEPIMEETSEDEEYALNSWHQYEQQASDNECEVTGEEGESSCGGTSAAGGASFWSSAESDTGSVIRVEINRDNDSTSERDFLCPAKRPRRCEESLGQSLNEEEVILRRPYADLKNNSLERFLNYENVSRDSWGANSQQRSSVGSRRGFDDFYSDSDSLSYNSLSRSSSLIQFESLERQLLIQEQHASMNSLGNSSPSLLSFETNNDDTTAKAGASSSNSANNSANNSRRGSQASLLKKYESLDGRLHQTYYDLDKLNFDDMGSGNGDNFSRAANLKVSSRAELRSDSESSSEGSEGSSRLQSVLSPSDVPDSDFLMKKFNKTNSQQIKKGKNSAENLSEDSGYCEPSSMGFVGLRRAKSQTLLKNYEKFSEEEEEMENKSLTSLTQTFIELQSNEQQNSIKNEFKTIATSQETINKVTPPLPPLSPQLEFIRNKQRNEAHSPSPVSSEVSTSSSHSTNSSNSSCSSSSASSTSSATTCASKASFTWLITPNTAGTAARQSSSSSSSSSEENPTSQISINDLRELPTSNEKNVLHFSGKLKSSFEKISLPHHHHPSSSTRLKVANENECLKCKNILQECDLNKCGNCGEKISLKNQYLQQNNFFHCQKCKEIQKPKEIYKKNNKNPEVYKENPTLLSCKKCGDYYVVELIQEKVRKKINEKQIQLLTVKGAATFVDTEINASDTGEYNENLQNNGQQDYSAGNSPKFLRNSNKNYISSCKSTPETKRRCLLKKSIATPAISFLGCSNSSDSDYSPLRLRKNFPNLMQSWPVKTSSVPNELNTIGRKKKLKKPNKTLSKNKHHHITEFSSNNDDNESVGSSSEELDLSLLNIKRSLSWSFQQNLPLETIPGEVTNLGLLHQSYHNLALLNLDCEEKQKMSERRISSDYEAEIVCKNNFLLDELSAHFDRTASILNDKPIDDETDQPPNRPETLNNRKSSNSSCSSAAEEQVVQHVSLVIRQPPARQKRGKGGEKVNSLTEDFSFASIMQCGGAKHKTFDQDPTMLKTSYAQSLEKCNFDCRELSSTQDVSKARALPKRRFHSQANNAKKKNLVSSTPNLNAYDFQHEDDIEDDMFVSSAHTSMHQLPLSQTQKPLGILLPAGSRTSFGKEVSFCPVVSKYCWQEQSSEECNDGNEEPAAEEGDAESEDELLDNADATVIYNTKENENIASKYNEEFFKRDTTQENIIYKERQLNDDDELSKENSNVKEEINSKQELEKENTQSNRDEQEIREKNEQKEETTESGNETEERNESISTATQYNNEPQVTTVSLTTNINNETLKTQTDDVQTTDQNKRVNNNCTITTKTSSSPNVVVPARPLSIQLPILSEPPINRAHHILYASQQMLDNFQKQQQNEQFEHFKSQSTQNLSKMSMSEKTVNDLQTSSSSVKLNNNNEIMKTKFKHEEKHPNSKGFLSRFTNGFRFSLRRNKKKLQQKEQQQNESVESQEQNKNNKLTAQNKSKSLPAAGAVAHKQQADFIHIPLKGPLPDNRNGNAARGQANGNTLANNGNAKNTAVLLKQKGAKTNNTNDKQQQKVTGKPPIPPQQQQQIQQFHKMQGAQSSQQQQQQQPLVEVGQSRFYTETESNTNSHPATTLTQDFLTSERDLYNENNYTHQQFTTTASNSSSQSCANNHQQQLLLSEANDVTVNNMTAINANNTATYEFTSPSRASVSQKTQMFNNLSRKTEQQQQQPKIGLIETNLDTHETIITGKTRSLINIGPSNQLHQQQQQRYAGNKRLHTTTNSHHNHHLQQYGNRHHLCDGNEADDDDYDDNDDDEVVVRPDGTVVVIKNTGTNGSSSSQAAQIVSVRRPHKSMEFLLDKENQKDVMVCIIVLT